MQERFLEELGVKYKCGRCGAVFEEEERRKTYGKYHLRCSECGYEIIYKVARDYRIVRAI